MSETIPWSKMLTAPAAEVYKQDRRSRVWQPEGTFELGGEPRTVVIKRYEYAGWRQWLSWWFRNHPVQREQQAADRLAASGVKVLDLLAWGLVGTRGCLVTEQTGRSLQAWLEEASASRAERRQVHEALVEIVTALVDGGWFFRDLKVANILVDDSGGLRLIDTGSARTVGELSREQVVRMLATLDWSARRAGATRHDRRRVFVHLMKACPQNIETTKYAKSAKMAGRKIVPFSVFRVFRSF